MNIGGLGRNISDSLYGMFIGAVMLSLTGGPGVGVTGVECVDNFCAGVWVTLIGANCTDVGCGIFLCSELAVMMLLLQK